MRLSRRSSVDFPQPDGPMSAVTSLLRKSMVMSVRALNAP